MPEKTVVELGDLLRILAEGAGVPEGVELNAEVLDVAFEDLGYDSIAMLETATRISREFGICLDDEDVATAPTPRRLLEVVNIVR